MSDRIEAESLDVFGEEVDAAVDTPFVVIKGPKGDPGAAGKDGHCHGRGWRRWCAGKRRR